METPVNIGDAMRKTSEAYVDGLSAVMKALESLPRQGGETHRRMIEDWLGLARASKESFVSAVNQGFDLWERECRRLVGAPHPPGAPTARGNPMEMWLENWKRTTEAFAAGASAGAYAEVVRKQTEMVQQALQEGMRAWQQFWQPPERK